MGASGVPKPKPVARALPFHAKRTDIVSCVIEQADAKRSREPGFMLCG